MATASKQKQLGKVPLERAFSKLGLASRSQAKKWITEGNVRLNGKVITDPLYPVVPERAKISLNNVVLKSSTWRTVMLYKPKGVVTTRSDEQGRPTVFSLLAKDDGYLHPVGRLDMATTGLLLLTNDTRFSSWLTDPKNKIVRVYLVTVEGCVTDMETRKIMEGVQDKGELLKAEKVSLRKTSARESHLTVELTEGKNREIRRIFEKIGHEVITLKRVAFGGLQLGKMAPGQSRDVSPIELFSAFGPVTLKV
jgi:pseudouridine synthase